MTSSQINFHSEPAKIEQIIPEFFAQTRHIILESRSPCVSSHNYCGVHTLSSPSSSSSSSSSVRPRDKRFNLALRESLNALENPEQMVVDVILVQRSMDLDHIHCSTGRNLVRNLSLKEGIPNCLNSEQEEYLLESKSGKIIERWMVQYEGRKRRDSNSGSKKTDGISSHSLYNKSNILLRSLYLIVRLLPAYNISRDLNSSGQIRNFSLAHRVSSFVEPFTHRQEAEMQQFEFISGDTSCGRLHLSVLYRPMLLDVNSEPSSPISPQFVPDYVGSPTTDPFKWIPSLPLTGIVSQGSPSSAPFARQNRRSYDLYRASVSSAPPSPSPTFSDSRASSSNISSHCLQPVSSGCHTPEIPQSSNASLAYKKKTSFDEYFPSPTFTPSPSPSPPTHLPSTHLSKALLRSESAPVIIPTGKLVLSPVLPSSHVSPPFPSPRGTRPGCSSQTNNVRASMGLGDVPTSLAMQKFARPSAVDDANITDPSTRPESLDGKEHVGGRLEPGGLLPVRKSQVAALLRLLETAPPLQQDFSNLIKLYKVSTTEIWSKSIQEPDESSNEAGVVQNAASDLGMTSYGLLRLKTTTEAWEELQSYREMKDLFLRQRSGS